MATVTAPGRKNDVGKPDYSAYLHPLFATPELAPIVNQLRLVLERGAEKYGADNWHRVSRERYWRAALRHLTQSGDDPETGAPHTVHAICSLLFFQALTEMERSAHVIASK